MREIKFRAWDEVNKLYYYNVQNTYDKKIGDNFQNVLDNENLMVEEFTGLKDKNGVDVYEADVLWTGVDYVYIAFKSGAFVVISGIDDEMALSEYPIDEWTISGNIHENAALLEE